MLEMKLNYDKARTKKERTRSERVDLNRRGSPVAKTSDDRGQRVANHVNFRIFLFLQVTTTSLPLTTAPSLRGMYHLIGGDVHI